MDSHILCSSLNEVQLVIRQFAAERSKNNNKWPFLCFLTNIFMLFFFICKITNCSSTTGNAYMCIIMLTKNALFIYFSQSIRMNSPEWQTPPQWQECALCVCLKAGCMSWEGINSILMRVWYLCSQAHRHIPCSTNDRSPTRSFSSPSYTDTHIHWQKYRATNRSECFTASQTVLMTCLKLIRGLEDVNQSLSHTSLCWCN